MAKGEARRSTCCRKPNTEEGGKRGVAKFPKGRERRKIAGESLFYRI